MVVSLNVQKIIKRNAKRIRIMQFLLFLLKLYLLGTLRYPASTSTRHKFSLYNLKTFAKHAFPAMSSRNDQEFREWEFGSGARKHNINLLFGCPTVDA